MLKYLTIYNYLSIWVKGNIPRKRKKFVEKKKITDKKILITYLQHKGFFHGEALLVY